MKHHLHLIEIIVFERSCSLHSDGDLWMGPEHIVFITGLSRQQRQLQHAWNAGRWVPVTLATRPAQQTSSHLVLLCSCWGCVCVCGCVQPQLVGHFPSRQRRQMQPGKVNSAITLKALRCVPVTWVDIAGLQWTEKETFFCFVCVWVCVCFCFRVVFSYLPHIEYQNNDSTSKVRTFGSSTQL